MGKKRITYLAEVTYPAEDVRTLDELVALTMQGASDAATANGGVLARIAIQGASTDPDPEPTAEDLVIAPPAPESGDPVIP